MNNCQAKVKLVMSLLTHFMDIVAQIATLLILMFGVRKFQIWSVVPLGSLWFADLFLHARKAWKEDNPHFGCFTWTLRAFFFGIARWSQVSRILEVYQKSRETHGAREAPLLNAMQAPDADGQTPPFLHGQTSHSVVTAFPFALMSLYAFCVMDTSEKQECQWHIYISKGSLWMRWVLGATGLVSITSIAACALEVDYAASGWVCAQVQSSIFYSALHLARRWFEVAYRVALLIVFAVIMRTIPVLNKALLGPVVLFLPAALFWIINTSILYYTRPDGAPEDAFLAHVCVGFVALVVVPSTFVDVSGYQAAAKSVTWGLWMVQSLAMCCLTAVAYLVTSFKIETSAWCSWKNPNKVLPNYLIDLHAGLLISSGATLFMYIFLSMVSRTYYGTPAERHDGAVLRIRPSHSPEQESQSLRVVAPRGLSSLLLRYAVGFKDNVFGEAEEYVIERELGRGQYGQVVQVRRESRRSNQEPQKYAVKLHSGSRKEAELHAMVDHPFCVQLLDHFRVRSDQTFLNENGEAVGGRFHRAIRMELCSAGTLEMELARNWCLHSGPPRAALLQEGPLRTTHVQLLRHWRRLAAELAEVMACLHGKNPPIVYRDLKPDNVLMREGSDSQLHVCLTDFGYAKQPQFMHEMATPAGNFLTAAPEVPRPWEERRPYTQHVDNWSLGMTMLCMLWCTHEVYHNQQVPVKPERSLWEDEGDPRIPPQAAKLIKTLTQVDPLKRGTMRKACQSEFFTEGFMHMGEEFQPIQMQCLLDAARR